MIIYIICCILTCVIGYQIYNKDFQLLTGQYNYRISYIQGITYIAFAIMILSFIIDKTGVAKQTAFGLLGIVIAAISEYVLSRIQSSNVFFNYGVRLSIVIATAVGFFISAYTVYLPFFLFGWYVRNNKFGVPHRNTLILAKYFRRVMTPIVTEEVEVDIPQSMPIFAYAGNQCGTKEKLPIYDVTNYKILPNTGEDLIGKLQLLIDNVGNNNGGIIYFPKGKYLFNKEGKKQFLQINHNNIVLDGELDDRGRPLAELVNCGSTVQGRANPWLSPFFITTGEQIQRSNIFFGLQFRKKKDVVMRSTSMSDPGSDGTIITPDFATKVIKTSKKGEDILYVEDAKKIGKYIMLGMYNTDKEASLLKDILGQDVIRPEWQAASRAGEEEAPSFQWLIEVKEIVDEHTIRLIQPLWRDCDMKYEPAVFNVSMLENVTIKNLKLSSIWNGMFRHHGHKRYYSVAQALEMDYGWNGINMKRVAHGNIENVVFKNFTNPLYVMDSRNVSCEHLVFKGHDGHQGIKMYEHACDNLFRDIVFYNHYADMMGGEGNAYGNVFSDVKYHNPCFKPVDFDFHGFSEGPMSPPSYNLFENVYGFAQIRSSGSLHMYPSCGRTNVWWNCFCEGEKRGEFVFKLRYKPRLVLRNYIGIIVRSGKKMLKMRMLNPIRFKEFIKQAYDDKIKEEFIPQTELSRFYTDFYLYGMNTAADSLLINQKYVHVKNWNLICKIKSLYDSQREKCLDSINY